MVFLLALDVWLFRIEFRLKLATFIGGEGILSFDIDERILMETISSKIHPVKVRLTSAIVGNFPGLILT